MPVVRGRMYSKAKPPNLLFGGDVSHEIALTTLTMTRCEIPTLGSFSSARRPQRQLEGVRAEAAAQIEANTSAGGKWRNGQIVRNEILRNLAPLDFEYIRPLLQPVILKERTILQEPNRRVEYVSFIESGLVSLVTMAPGVMLETAMVGSNGVIPACVALGAYTSVHRSVVLVSGNALSIRVEDLRRAMEVHPLIREHLLRYVDSVMRHVSQTSLCAVQHHIEQRLAGWLCLACDALDGNVLPVTHNHLSSMLGFHRSVVTQVLLKFEQQGLLKKMRGVLEVRDRKLLGQRACCCYPTIADAYQRNLAISA